MTSPTSRAPIRRTATHALQAGAVSDHRKLLALRAGVALISLDLGALYFRERQRLTDNFHLAGSHAMAIPVSVPLRSIPANRQMLHAHR